MTDYSNSPHTSPASPNPSEPVEHPQDASTEEQPEASTSNSVSASPMPEVVPESSSNPSEAETSPPTAWQAIFSPQHNAYYFFNSVTQETTWTNPLQPEQSASAPAVDLVAAPTSASPPAHSTSPQPGHTTGGAASYAALQAAAAAQGIDPSLAYLDPSLAGPSTPGAFTYTAKFNARTGAFAKPDGRDPTHLSEYERAKRMSEFYFDTGAWEKEVEERKRKEQEELEGEGRKRKKPTKKDLERFKEQKKQKKIAKTAWLRT